MTKHGEIMIAGGGIGGLTAALALQQRGIEATVFEAAREIRPLGVGINLLPHSVRVLSALGLQDELAASAIETAELAYFNRHGQPIWSEPRAAPPATTTRSSRCTAASCSCCSSASHASASGPSA